MFIKLYSSFPSRFGTQAHTFRRFHIRFVVSFIAPSISRHRFLHSIVATVCQRGCLYYNIGRSAKARAQGFCDNGRCVRDPVAQYPPVRGKTNHDGTIVRKELTAFACSCFFSSRPPGTGLLLTQTGGNPRMCLLPLKLWPGVCFEGEGGGAMDRCLLRCFEK